MEQPWYVGLLTSNDREILLGYCGAWFELISELSNKSSDSKTVVWSMRDLRVDDNLALAIVAKEGTVLPTFTRYPKGESQFYPGQVSR